MIDIHLFRNDPEILRNACRLKGANVDIDKGIKADERRRSIIFELEKLRAERKTVSKEIGAAKKAGEDAEEKMAQMREVGAQIKKLEQEFNEVETELKSIALVIPNHPASDVPEGADETANEYVSEWGEKPTFDFEPKPHWELCENLGLANFKAGAKLAGSGFILYTGLGARLERALINFFLDLHTTEHGYTEVFPPTMVNTDSMTGTGQLPKFGDDLYKMDMDDLYLIPTAEVPITNIHREEILPADQLPIRYTGFSSCFRREAGAAGKDTRGLLRVHEFHKVELVKFVEPSTSYDELETLRINAETVLQKLGLHYRVAKLCTGDLSFAAAKCYDLEAWAPGADRYLEVSSASNFEDFQARRANIRYRDTDRKIHFLHTLNASGVACPRTMAAILETYQQADGSVIIPEVLRPYMNGMEVLTAK